MSIDNTSLIDRNALRSRDADVARAAARSADSPLASTRSLSLTMLGPALSVKGGVSSVERLILAQLPSNITATHIATMVDGSKASKVLAFLQACCRVLPPIGARPDLIHLHFASRASSVRKKFFAQVALRRGIPVVMHAHGAEYRMYWEEMSARQRARTLSVLRRVSALIVLGEAWREFFLSIGVPAEKIMVLPNPVQLPRAVPERVTQPVLRVAYLGILSRRKGVFDLIQAIASLERRQQAHMRVTLAGNGKVEEVRALIAQQGLATCVEVRDWLSPAERDALLAASDAFVLPSYNEGLPMALLEAMAWGLAPITTPVGSIGEVIEDGANGLLVTPGDVDALKGALVRLIERIDERERMQRAARATVEAFDVDVYMEKLVALYRTVVADASA